MHKEILRTNSYRSDLNFFLHTLYCSMLQTILMKKTSIPNGPPGKEGRDTLTIPPWLPPPLPPGHHGEQDSILTSQRKCTVRTRRGWLVCRSSLEHLLLTTWAPQTTTRPIQDGKFP